MRIGFFTDSYLPRLDGIAISVETFRKYLERLGHEVYVFCPERPEPFAPANDRIYRFKSYDAMLYDEYRNTFPFTKKHIDTIKRLNLDIVHVHTPLQIGMLGNYMARKQKIPVVTTCHSDPGLFKDYIWLKGVFGLASGSVSLLTPHHTKRPHLANPLSIKHQIKTYFNNFDAIISPSEKIDRHVKDLGIKTRSEVIATGFDTDLMPKENQRDIKRKELDIKEDAVVFVSTSRHVKEKRIDFILHSFALAAQDKPNYLLLIIGDGPEHKKLLKLSAALNIKDQVKFIGKQQRNDLVATLQASDVLVNACLRETQGLVFNEAAAVGLPVIALESDINPLMIHEKTSLIPQGTPEAYAAALRRLGDNSSLRLKYGAEAKKLALKYDSENQARELVKVYEQLLAN